VDAHLLDILQLAREGQRETALLRLRAYVQAHPAAAEAWVVLGGLAPDRKIALSALRRAVQLAPENVMAREALAALEAQDVVSPEPPPVEPGAGAPAPAERLDPAPPSSPIVAAPTEWPEAPLLPTTLPLAPEEDGASPEIFEPEQTSAWDADEECADEVSVEVACAEEPPQATGETEIQTLRDARDVLWPFAARGQKNRTIGALLDENRLTRQDLLWAVQEARNVDVRRAALVILENAHRLSDVTMSPEDARLLSWPFRRLNRPLGKLVDAGTVKVKDLRRAAWYAKDARLREAARVMLPAAIERREAEQLKQATPRTAAAPKSATPKSATPKAAAPKSAAAETPKASDALPEPPVAVAPQPERKPNRIRAAEVSASAAPKTARADTDPAMVRPMPVIQGSDYLAHEVQRRYQKNLFIAAFIFMLALAGLLIVAALIVLAFSSQRAPALWLWPLAVALFLPLFVFSERFVELWHEELNFRRGQLGESEVARLLRLGLGCDWTLFRNVKLPGSKVDIDMVLLGPPGVFALEVKAYTGDYRYARQHFYRRAMTWRRMQHNPGKQARASAGLLHAYIRDTLNEEIWVEPRLVWVGPGALTLEEPEVFVWFTGKLDQETERLRALPRKLSAEKRAALSGLLRGLCSTLR
jgi:hypothetical protein